MTARTLDPDPHVIDLCIVTDRFGVRVFEVPALPRSPYLCPGCGRPFWSRWARCSGGNGGDAGHPSVTVIGRIPDQRATVGEARKVSFRGVAPGSTQAIMAAAARR